LGCQGRVKMICHDRGFGYIYFQGRDVFFHKNDCLKLVPTVDLTVYFDVIKDLKSGQVKAVKVRSTPQEPPAELQPATGRRGTVKQFCDMKGFGFISYQGIDVFFRKVDCRKLVPAVGQVVYFDVVRDSVSGRPRCAKVRSTPQDVPERLEPQPAVGCQGTVKEFDDDKGFGLITLSSGEEVFFHRRQSIVGSGSNRGLLCTGLRVHFDVTKDAQSGKIRADNICFAAVLMSPGEIRPKPGLWEDRLLVLLNRSKPPPPKNRDDAMVHLAHAAIHDCQCLIYGGYVRDWCIRGEGANDLDVSTRDVQGSKSKILSAVSGFGMTYTGEFTKGAAHTIKLSFQGQEMEVDLVNPDGVPHTAPGCDCDVGNIAMDQRGCFLKSNSGSLVSLSKSIKHCLDKKFVFYYECGTWRADRRLSKYVQERGWICKSKVPPSVASNLGLPAQHLKPKDKYSKRWWEM